MSEPNFCPHCGRAMRRHSRQWRDTLSADWLRDEYVVKGKSLTQIGEEIGVSFQTIRQALIKHGIPRRSISESHQGKTLSAEHRAKIGDALRGRTR